MIKFKQCSKIIKTNIWAECVLGFFVEKINCYLNLKLYFPGVRKNLYFLKIIKKNLSLNKTI